MKSGEYYIRRGTAKDPDAPGGILARLEERKDDGDHETEWRTSYWAFCNDEAFYYRANVHVKEEDLLGGYKIVDKDEALKILTKEADGKTLYYEGVKAEDIKPKEIS